MIKETLDKLRGSRLTALLLFWLGFILFNTFIGRQIHRFLFSTGGRELILAAIVLVAVVAVVLLTLELRRIHLPMKLKPLAVLLLLAVVAAALMPIPEETLHIVKYGGLGFLAQALVYKQGISNRLAFAFIITISVLDEVIQYYLPYRVGDLRDVALNIVSGIWGASIVLCAVKKDRKTAKGSALEKEKIL